MENIPFIFSNYYIDVAFLAWLIAQVLKTLINFLLTKEFVWEQMVGAGDVYKRQPAIPCVRRCLLRWALSATRLSTTSCVHPVSYTHLQAKAAPVRGAACVVWA